MDRTISSFLQHLIVEKGFSRNTSDAYRNDLGQFWEFLQTQSNGHGDGNGNYAWAMVDINVLNKYIEDLRVRKGYRDTTTARKVASIKSFFGFLSENSIITEDPTESLGSRLLPAGIWAGCGRHEETPGIRLGLR
jgi:integrase/recombinase XerD